MRTIFVSVISLIGFGCIVTQDPAPSASDTDEQAATPADFAVTFYKRASEVLEGNIVISPISVESALAILLKGANGETAAEIESILSPDQNVNVDAFYKSLLPKLRINNEKTTLNIVNGLFPRTGLAVNDDFANEVNSDYQCPIEETDYDGDLEGSRQQINNWVSEQTVGKIPELFKQGVLKGHVSLVLANAVYFKDQWLHGFDEHATEPGTFYADGREEEAQTVSFMYNIGKYGYADTGSLRVVELQFSDQMAMYILLPKEKDGLATLQTELTGEMLTKVFKQVKPLTIELTLPRFTIRTEVNLNLLLHMMGVEKIFTDSADFSRITSGRLKVSKAVHEAFIRIDENGAEAAAATGFAAKTRSLPPVAKEEVNVDHPFLYAIVDKPTCTIVFIGKVNSIDEERTSKRRRTE